MIGLNMKTTVLLMLLALYGAKTEPVTSRSKQKTSGTGAAGKRELEEGNVFGKRAPVLATASPSLSPGIEYADTKELDKSPIQQYDSVPQIGKISDVLTGQGPFQAAIAGHLYSPVSVYQQRVPTQTYEVGPPVPSQLAYSEHRVSIPNFNQYNPQKQQLPQIPIFNQKQNFDQPHYQQFHQLQQLLQRIPNNHFLQPFQYNPLQPALQPHVQQSLQPAAQLSLQPALQPHVQQSLQPAAQLSLQPALQSHVQQSLQPAPQPSLQPAIQFPQQLQYQQIPSQPNIVFNQNQQNEQNYQINQRDLKSQPLPSQILQKQNIEAYNQKPQNALSYATFIYNPVDSIQQPQLPQQIQQNYQQQQQNYQQQQQNYQQQNQQQPRPQIQYQLQHPLLGNYNALPIQFQPQDQRLQPQFNQLQLQPQQYDVPAHTKSYQREAKPEPEFRNILPAPTFPPVQYFGKFAPSILNYH